MIIKLKKENGIQWIDRNLSAWEASRTEHGPIYTVQETLENGKKLHTTVYGNVAGCELTAVDALALYKGRSVDHCNIQYKPHAKGKGAEEYRRPCTLVPTCVETQLHEHNGKIYNNRTLKVNVAWHLLRKGTEDVFAYRCDNEVFLKENRAETFWAELTPADCFTLKSQGCLALGHFELTYEPRPQVEESQNVEVDNTIPVPLPELEDYHVDMMQAAQVELNGDEPYLRQALATLGRDKFEEILGETKAMVLEGQKIKKTPAHVFIYKLKAQMEELPASKKVNLNNFALIRGSVKQDDHVIKMRVRQ